jgi:hypothetical protein
VFVVTALNDSLVLAAELGRVAAGIEKELLRRCDRQDARMLELLDRLDKAEKTIADLTRRVRAAERAQRPPRSRPVSPNSRIGSRPKPAVNVSIATPSSKIL